MIFGHKYRLLFIILLGAYSYVNTLFVETYVYYGLNVPWYKILLVMTIVIFAVWELNHLAIKFIKKLLPPMSTVKCLVIFLATGVALASVAGSLIVYSAALFTRLPADKISITVKLGFIYATRINLFLHIVNAIRIFVIEYKSKELEAEELKRTNAQAQLQAIRNQVNPHFLFNNLNVLSAMVVKENPGANKFIEEFSKVYRHILNSQDKELVAVELEMSYIKPYIYLLQTRFPDSLIINVNIEPKYYSYLIVPAALQMLIENATKHNIASATRPLQITIDTDSADMLRVTNNLQIKISGESSTRVGLQNISQRYQLITGKNIVIDNKNNFFSVALPLINASYADADHRR
jgi:sensor histidine kinase YesM